MYDQKIGRQPPNLPILRSVINGAAEMAENGVTVKPPLAMSKVGNQTVIYLAGGVSSDRLALAQSGIGPLAEGDLVYYRPGSASALTDPSETVKATNPHPSSSVPVGAKCIVGTLNGISCVKGWFCS